MDSYDDTSLGQDCRTTMFQAQQCATTQACIDPCVKQTAVEYLQCVQTAKYVDGTCPFAAFCMGTLFNDPQLDASGNPVLGTNSLDFGDILKSAASESIATSSCTPFEPFVSKVCQLGQNCCASCDAKLGALTNCLVNNFVLPLFKLESGITDNGLQCPVSESPCGLATTATSRSGGRNLANDLGGNESSVNITGCEQSLSMDWILHNETYAAGEFFNCIGEQMIKIVAEEDENPSDASSAWRVATMSISSLVGVAVASFF